MKPQKTKSAARIWLLRVIILALAIVGIIVGIKRRK